MMIYQSTQIKLNTNLCVLPLPEQTTSEEGAEEGDEGKGQNLIRHMVETQTKISNHSSISSCGTIEELLYGGSTSHGPSIQIFIFAGANWDIISTNKICQSSQSMKRYPPAPSHHQGNSIGVYK